MFEIEDLGVNGLKIVQSDNLYKFTSDAVLLSRFARVKNGDVVADLCSGSGIVGLHLYGENSQKIKSVTMFEMQKPLFEMSIKSVEINNLQNVFSGVNTRLQDIAPEYYGKFSLCVCNPPYMEVQKGFSDKNQEIDICKREVTLSLEEFVVAMSKVLKFGGRGCVVHRADRLADLIVAMRKNNLEPKRLQTISAKGKEPYLILLEVVKGGKSGIKILSQAENNVTTGKP